MKNKLVESLLWFILCLSYVVIFLFLFLLILTDPVEAPTIDYSCLHPVDNSMRWFVGTCVEDEGYSFYECYETYVAALHGGDLLNMPVRITDLRSVTIPESGIPGRIT
jgi:hypothetical protein